GGPVGRPSRSGPVSRRTRRSGRSQGKVNSFQCRRAASVASLPVCLTVVRDGPHLVEPGPKLPGACRITAKLMVKLLPVPFGCRSGLGGPAPVHLDSPHNGSPLSIAVGRLPRAPRVPRISSEHTRTPLGLTG